MSPLSVVALVVAVVGLWWQVPWLVVIAAAVSLTLGLLDLAPSLKRLLGNLWQARPAWLAWVGVSGSLLLLIWVGGLRDSMDTWDWDIVGALGETLGAAGQILIAILAAYIAWRQYVISKDLTTQQNLITQQQTIDAYFQGISDLILSPEGQLDDWPLERVIAVGRTAAILNGVDANGKAKILRFLSMANLLSPLQRDQHLGRPILDGQGGYVRDRSKGIRVIWLGSLLDQAVMPGVDLRGIDFSDISLVNAQLHHADLSYCNMTGCDLRSVQLQGATLYKTLFFVGDGKMATPAQIPPPTAQGKGNFKTGEGTGARVEGINCRHVKELSEDQRYYLCSWGGSLTRSTIPGGCQDIPDRTSELKI
ncbi:MAG: pentapeptide repeat-containing protein [Synechococcales cyanobacterium]